MTVQTDPFSDPDLLACARITEKGDPDRFSALMAAPPAARAQLFPLYAFNVEVARAPWVTEEAMIAEMRLQWWRDALGEIAAGGLVRRHEVVTPLALGLTPRIAEMLDASVAARRWDIYRDTFEDAAHFEAYLDQTAGHLMWASVAILGSGDEAEVRRLAFAQGLAGFLRAVPELEARGRVPLVDGREEAVRLLARRGLDALNAFRRAKVDRAAWPALMPAFAARPVLSLAARDPRAVAQGRLQTMPLHRSWRLFRATSARF